MCGTFAARPVDVAEADPAGSAGLILSFALLPWLFEP
jgi:hypothetical protein